MRVLIICGAGIVSGKEVMTLHLLHGLKDRGYECHCITAYWGSPEFRKKLNGIGVPYTVLRLGFISKTLSWDAVRMTLEQAIHWPLLLIRYRRLIRHFKPDHVIHTNFHHVFLLYPLLNFRRDLYWSHEVIPGTPFYRRLFRFFHRQIDRFVGVSHAASAALTAFLPADRVTTVRNGISFPQVGERPSRGSTCVFGIVGQISHAKGHELLLHAFADYREWQTSVRLRIIGSGKPDYITHLKGLSRQLGLEDTVEWAGYVTDIQQIYHSIDVLVVPSLVFESYPTTVMEAGVFGVPAVAAAVGGLPEMIKPGVNGFLFRSNDKDDLVAKLRLLLDRDSREQLSITARHHATDHFGVDRFCDEFAHLLLKV